MTITADDEYKGYRTWRVSEQHPKGPKVIYRVIEVIADSKRQLADFKTDALKDRIDTLEHERD